jgi:hypothetical protein
MERLKSSRVARQKAERCRRPFTLSPVMERGGGNFADF